MSPWASKLEVAEAEIARLESLIGIQQKQIELLIMERTAKLPAAVAAFIKDCRDNFDCDEDAHKYGTSCRSCDAALLIPKK